MALDCGLLQFNGEAAIEFCQNWNTDHSEPVAIQVSEFTAIWPRYSPIDARKWRTAL